MMVTPSQMMARKQSERPISRANTSSSRHLMTMNRTMKITDSFRTLMIAPAMFAPAGFEKDVPYALGVAEFDEGMKVFGRLDRSLSDEQVKTGMKVRIRVVDLGDERLSYELTSA